MVFVKVLDMLIRDAAKSSLSTVARKTPWLLRASQFLTDSLTTREYSYSYLRDRFIENGFYTNFDSKARSEIVGRFEDIDRSMRVSTTRTDGLFLAEALLNVTAGGDVLECGCYKGGSTAKLSIVAKILGKKLVVFDSCQGLPENSEDNLNPRRVSRPLDGHQWKRKGAWPAGTFQGSLDEVRDNVARFGEIDVCHFVKGWFKDTLTAENLPERVSMAFVDVDLADSARTCLGAIWPRLSHNAIYFSHDVNFIPALLAMHDRELWTAVLKDHVPILFGAGFGLRNESPHLGFFVKGTYSWEYLKSLTIAKWHSDEIAKRVRKDEFKGKPAEAPA